MRDGLYHAWLDRLSPVQFLALSFVVAIILGSILLLLPVSTTEPITPIDALFTATSAVCVTGLIVVDTGTRFTPFGQGVILALIQFGGLGIMTTSSFLLLAFRQRTSLRNLIMLREEYTVTGFGSAWQLILTIALFTVGAEVVGAVVLTQRFAETPSLAHNAVWCGIFHSISAFCNAGFSLFSTSFTGYRGDVTVNLTVPLLIILGGIGFPVIIGLCRTGWARVCRRRRVLTLHAKIVLISTLALLAAGTAAFLAMEWGSAQLDGAGLSERLGTAWFQSVTTRTAGFNTLDFAAASEPTLLTAIILMIIGGSPGSAAGGIKTTTFVVILLVVIAWLRGQDRVEAGKRTIPNDVIMRALVVAVLGVALIVAGTLLLLLTDGSRVQAALDAAGVQHGSFVSLLFEVVSAFGTVGLSVLDTATTGALTWMGKLVIIVVMYLGRLGPLALAQMVLTSRRPINYRYPEEHLLVG
ncbi:MAG: potassium transporter TrkG [Planctomycetota bacterium]